MIKFGVRLLLLCLLFGTACKSGKKRARAIRDVSINNKNAYNNLFMDSLQLANFLANHKAYAAFQEQFEDFYQNRNYAYAWFDNKGLAEQAHNFHNLLDAYIQDFSDSSLYNASLEKLHKAFMESGHSQRLPDSMVLKTELFLTGQFFQYAAKVYKGSDLNAAELGWFIPRKKIDLHTLLDAAIDNKVEETSFQINPQYKKLAAFIQTYRTLERKNDWDTIAMVKKALKHHDSADIIPLIKKRLQYLGDLSGTDSSTQFDTTLVLGVKHFQKRMGLTEDGVIGNKLIAALNVPIRTRIRQLLVNLERLRWMPVQQDSNFILVNIPDYSLQVFENGKPALRMNVIVGTAANNTVIFTGKLQYIVFSPYWNVPESIVRKEILPAMKRNPGYLAKNNMEITTDGPIPVIRQKSGPANSLGLVKFLFPNSYNIYLHDTPNRNLFAQTSRSFSHGCIRISEPKKMATYLLQQQPEWTSNAIDSAMHAGKEKWVTLKKPLPVFIVYFTAWVDNEGLLNFRNDIYKHDEKMAAKLFAE